MAKSSSFETKFRQAFVNAAMGVLARDDAGFTDPSKWKVAGKEGKFYIDDGTMEGTGSLFASKPEAERALAQMKASRLPLLGGGKVEKVDKGYGRDSSFLKNGEEIRHLRLVRDGIKFRCQNRQATPEEKEEIQSINKQIMQLKTGTVGAKDASEPKPGGGLIPALSRGGSGTSYQSSTGPAALPLRRKEDAGEARGGYDDGLEDRIKAARTKMNQSKSHFEEEEARGELRKLERERMMRQGEDVSPEQQTDAYHKGVKAGASGVQREANPYNPGSEEHGRWIYGHAYGKAGETAGHDAFDEPASEEQRKKNEEWNRNQRPSAEGQELYNRTSGHVQATKKKLDWWPAHQHNPDPSQYDGLDENDEIEEEGGADKR